MGTPWETLTKTKSEVWAKDWTKALHPEDLAPGTEVIDPIDKNRIPSLVNRPVVEVNTEDFKRYQKTLGVTGEIAFFIAKVLPAHNEGTKFGSRKVLIATPIILNSDAFVGNDDLKPYVIMEQRYQMENGLQLLMENGQPSFWSEIVHQSRSKSMEAASHDGNLKRFQQFVVDHQI